MKKSIIFILIVTIGSFTFAQNNGVSKYSKEIDCEYPFSGEIQKWLKWAEEDVDLERYKTIIRNGDISAIEKPYLNDLQLGTLSKTELKLFRNLFYAKKGYIFSDEELGKYDIITDKYKAWSCCMNTDENSKGCRKIKIDKCRWNLDNA